MTATVRTPEVERAIFAMLKLGHFRGRAARKAGIAPQTFSDWLARDPELRRQVEEIESDLEVRLLRTVSVAAREDPRMAQWILERRFPEDWGRRGGGRPEPSGDSNGAREAWFETEEGGDDGGK